jgi:putative ABC transport system substrate-binding protein
LRRREFIGLLGGAAVVWPLAARAQQPAMPVIGVLNAGGGPEPSLLAPFRKGLQEKGYVEGQNVAFENRGAEQYDQLLALANELVRHSVSVIFAAGTANAALAAKAATATIPIVFSNGSDPVKLGLVASLNRPGGNMTGVTNYAGALGPKRLELMRELVPQASTIAFLTNPTNLVSEGSTADMQAAARRVGQQIVVLNASTADEIDRAFATTAQQRIGALLINVDALFNARHDQIVALAARYQIPASYPTRIFAAAGGLMSYGDDREASIRQTGVYVGRILNGEKPADLPVLQPTMFQFVINLKTAKALGITFPPSFHLRADEVIE